jgi:hypothetical protein
MRLVKVKQPITGLDRPWGLQEVEAPRFQDSWHMKVVGWSTVPPAAFTPQEIFLVLISLRGWVDGGAIKWPEGLYQWKISMTLPGIEPATCRLVQRCKDSDKEKSKYLGKTPSHCHFIHHKFRTAWQDNETGPHVMNGRRLTAWDMVWRIYSVDERMLPWKINWEWCGRKGLRPAVETLRKDPGSSS